MAAKTRTTAIVTTDVIGLLDNPVQKEPDRFYTLSPMLASYDGDYISDPPCFDGRVPKDALGMLPGNPSGHAHPRAQRFKTENQNGEE